MRKTGGHPKGLYPLFFTEMWERLAFYLMVGILFLYAIDTERGGLGLPMGQAAEIYGTYLAFVYFTPFLGGMIADRFIGYRKAVLIGGILMASGLFALGVRSDLTFYAGLTLLCLGNGFFKPNISAMVGNLYSADDPRRDAGFNIFYMGINIGAATSALLAAPLRNLWDFNMAFMAAGVGLLIAVAILLGNWRTLERADRRPEPDPEDISFTRVCLQILLPAAVCGAFGYLIGAKVDAIANSVGPATFGFLIGAVPILSYFWIVIRRASPDEKIGLKALMPVYLAGGTFFMILHLNGGMITVFTQEDTNRGGGWMPSVFARYYTQPAMPKYFDNAGPEIPRPDEATLLKVDDNAAATFGARIMGSNAVAAILAANPGVTTVDPAGAGVDPDWGFLTVGVFPDENVKVTTEKDSHGKSSIAVRVAPEGTAPSDKVLFVRGSGADQVPLVFVTDKTYAAVYAKADESTERLEKGGFYTLVNAELITGTFNPIFVVVLTPLLVMFFGWLVVRGRPLTTARKIFLGMVLTTLSMVIMIVATLIGGNGADKVSVLWLFFTFMIITLGELCLSPMGLSLVTKLSPKRLVGLMMGGWFLATAIGNKLSGFISGLDPTTTIFIWLAVAALAVAGFIFALLPRLDAAIKKYGA